MLQEHKPPSFPSLFSVSVTHLTKILSIPDCTSFWLKLSSLGRKVNGHCITIPLPIFPSLPMSILFSFEPSTAFFLLSLLRNIVLHDHHYHIFVALCSFPCSENDEDDTDDTVLCLLQVIYLLQEERCLILLSSSKEWGKERSKNEREWKREREMRTAEMVMERRKEEKEGIEKMSFMFNLSFSGNSRHYFHLFPENSFFFPFSLRTFSLISPFFDRVG